MHWLSSLAPQVQPATLKSYLTHVKSMHIEADLDFSACESPLVQRLIRGIKRYHGEKGRKPKQPITLPVLTQLLKSLQPRNDPLHCVVYAACCLAFSGLLRCGEFTTKSSRFNPATHLSKSCIKFMPSPASPAYILLTLPASKTDPFRKGVTLTIAAAPGQPTCPVSAMQQLLQNSSASPDSPLFEVAPGIPLQRDTFIQCVRSALSQAGFDPRLYAGHSFRRGGASSAAYTGFSDHQIQLLGRWRSDAYKLYIETDHTRLLQLSTLLHWARPPPAPSRPSGPSAQA